MRSMVLRAGQKRRILTQVHDVIDMDGQLRSSSVQDILDRNINGSMSDRKFFDIGAHIVYVPTVLLNFICMRS